MTAVPLPFDVDGKPVRMPRRGVSRGVEKPVWSEYRVKVPVDCNHCEIVAYETALAGEPYPGMRKARRKRRQDGQNLLLCHEHARLLKEQDDIDFPPGKSETKGSASRGQRYIA